MLTLPPTTAPTPTILPNIQIAAMVDDQAIAARMAAAREDAKLLRERAAADPFYKGKDINKSTANSYGEDGKRLLPRAPAQTKGSVKASNARATGRAASPAPTPAPAPASATLVAAFDTGSATATVPSSPDTASASNPAPPSPSAGRASPLTPRHPRPLQPRESSSSSRTARPRCWKRSIWDCTRSICTRSRRSTLRSGHVPIPEARRPDTASRRSWRRASWASTSTRRQFRSGTGGDRRLLTRSDAADCGRMGQRWAFISPLPSSFLYFYSFDNHTNL